MSDRFWKTSLLTLHFILILAFSARAGSAVDSLEHLLSAATDPAVKTELLLNLCDQYINKDPVKAEKYGLRALGLAETNADKKQKLYSCLRLARIYFNLSDLKKAMEFAVKSKSLAESLNLDKERALSMDAMGLIYYDIGDQAKSSEQFFASLKIYEKLDDKNGIGANFCRIGTLYLDQKDYDKAADYYSKSIKIAREIKSPAGVSSNLNNLAKVYFKKKEYDKSLKNFEEALRMNIESGDSYLAGYNYLNIAEVYVEMKQYAEAISRLQKARAIFEKLGNKLRLAKSQVILGEIYLETGQFADCQSSALNALQIAQEQGYKEIIVSSASMLNKLYLTKKDSLLAFRYYILEKQFRDSLFLDEKHKTLTKLELQYQFEKTEQVRKTERQRRNVAIIIVSGCLFFSLIIIVLILKQQKLKARKQQLEKENFEKELAFKNKELVLNVMSLMKKNEMLADLSEKLVKIEAEATTSESKDTLHKVARELQNSQEEEIWKEFSTRFKEVHGEFYDKLLGKFPTLTPNELKLCAFLRLNMSSKDIAELTGQRITTLETARYRLRQKLGIVNSEVNLITFLTSL